CPRKALDDFHPLFGGRLEEYFFLARFEINGHEVPWDHAAGDIGVRVIYAHLITAPSPVWVSGAYRAEIFHHFAHFRIVDVQPHPIFARTGPVDPAVGSDCQWAYLAAQPRNDFPALLHGVVGRVINEQIHTPRLPRRRGNVILAVEAQS